MADTYLHTGRQCRLAEREMRKTKKKQWPQQRFQSPPVFRFDTFNDTPVAEVDSIDDALSQ